MHPQDVWLGHIDLFGSTSDSEPLRMNHFILVYGSCHVSLNSKEPMLGVFPTQRHSLPQNVPFPRAPLFRFLKRTTCWCRVFCGKNKKPTTPNMTPPPPKKKKTADHRGSFASGPPGRLSVFSAKPRRQEQLKLVLGSCWRQVCCCITRLKSSASERPSSPSRE